MTKYIFLGILVFFSYLFAVADPIELQKTDANIIGHVVDKVTNEHLPFVTLQLKGTTIGTTTDATGHYFLKGLPEGKFILEAKFVGYKTAQKEILIEKGETLEVNFEIEEDNITLNEVVVSANRNETSRRTAPTLVNILDVKVFDRTNSVSIADGLNFQPGLRVENNCQNCGFTQVRMNGLDGAYSQILIDSRPIFSALAGVYGLEQIPASMVERVEVVRGGGSALFGSSAIAGTINIITKEPLRNTAQISHSIMSMGGKSSFDNSTNFNGSLVSDNQRMGIMIFGQRRSRAGYDHDGDGFTEIPKLDSRTLGFRSFLKTSAYSKLTLEYHNMHEFRRGGDQFGKEPFEAYIAEQVESYIDGGGLKFDWFSPDTKHRLGLYSSVQLINRKSYYGGGIPWRPITPDNTEEEMDEINSRLLSFGRTKDVTYVLGGQYTYNFDYLWFLPSELTMGAEYNHDKLNDRSGYRPESIDQKVDIKSFFLQNEWKNEQWGFLVGGRVDKHRMLKNAVFSPRANVRYNPSSDVNIRVSYGQGFRAPQLYDEDLHVEIAGGEQIISVHSPNLKEEKSHSLSGSVDWYISAGNADINIMGETFYTKLKDPFTSVSEEQADGSVIKTVINADGAQVYGINMEGRAALGNLLQAQLGVTLQRSRYDSAHKWSDDEDDDVMAEKRMLRTPDVYGYFVASVTPYKTLAINLSGNYTGRMLVPHEAGYIERNRTEKTPQFFELNLKLAYEFPIYKGTGLEINGGIQNLTNAYQKDFDKGADRASSYVYGPSLPRSYFVGAKLNF